MRPIGFSTGALAHGDFRKGIEILREKKIALVELSALRPSELAPLISALDHLDLSFFAYVSVHAPSRLEEGTEGEVVKLLSRVAERGWPIIVHPDIIGDFDLWASFGGSLFIENMDKRKGTGRTASELANIFKKLPKSSLCFDLGHARQVDPTMSEAVVMLDKFSGRLGQLHVSEVNARSTHDPLTAAAMLAFGRISHLIREDIPVILESPVSEDHIEIEMSLAQQTLAVAETEVAGQWWNGLQARTNPL